MDKVYIISGLLSFLSFPLIAQKMQIKTPKTLQNEW